jgi:acyl-CoA dehydrogenase
MELSLSPAQRELQTRARAFAEEILAPEELIVEEHGILPRERRPALRAKVNQWELNAINQPREFGGRGLSLFEQTLVNEQLGRATNGLWTTVWQPAICLQAGTKDQIERYLRPACAGERRGCYAVTEPEAGSDVRRVRTRALREDDGWRISGEKWFVTSWDASDFVIVHANANDDPDQPTLFLVDRDAPGLVHLRSPKFMHTYTFDHAELRLDNVPVSDAEVLGGVGAGLELTRDWFVEAGLQIAAHCVGAATRAAETAEAFARERVQFDRAIREFQGVECQIADMAVDIMAGKSMLYRLAWEIDQGADRKGVHARASALKLFCSEMAGRVVDRALQVLGGRGYMRENPVERLYRDLRVDRIWEGTSEIQRVIIGGQIRKRGLDLYTGWM